MQFDVFRAGRPEAVAHAPDRLDQVRGPELAAQGEDVDVNRPLQDDGPARDALGRFVSAKDD